MADKLDLPARLEEWANGPMFLSDTPAVKAVLRIAAERIRALESASQPGIDALATAMHHAAIKYASGDFVDFQHEAREFLLASQPGGGEAVETLMMLMRANPNAYVSDILPHAEDYLARAAPSAGNGEAKGEKLSTEESA